MFDKKSRGIKGYPFLLPRENLRTSTMTILQWGLKMGLDTVIRDAIK